MSHEEVEKVRWELVEKVRRLTPKELKSYHDFRGFGELYCSVCGRQYFFNELYCLSCERRRGPYFHLFYDLNHEPITPLSEDTNEFFYLAEGEGMIYGVSKDYGALRVWTKLEDRGSTLCLSPASNESENTAFANVVVKQYTLDEFFAVAVFPHLLPGNYTLAIQGKTSLNAVITIVPGNVMEVDWR